MRKVHKKNKLANDYWKKLDLNAGKLAGELYSAFIAGWDAAKRDARCLKKRATKRSEGKEGE